MSYQELIKRLMNTFVLELREHVAALNENLLRLEACPDGEAASGLINNLFRAAHSLKGAARSVELHPLEALSHAIEERFVGLRAGTLSLSPPLTAALFSAIDAMARAGDRLEAGQALADGECESLCATLERFREDNAGRRTAPLDGTGSSPATPVPGGVLPPLQQDTRPEAERGAPGKAAGQGRNKPVPDIALEGNSLVQIDARQLDRILAYGSEFGIASRRYEQRLRALSPLLAELRQQLGKSGERGPAGLHGVLSLMPALDDLIEELKAGGRSVQAACQPLDAELQRLRTVPFKAACEGLHRVVRDLAVGSGKQVELILEGEELEIDRTLMKLLRQSLLQLVRNAVDHGLEASAVRRAEGKPEVGRLRIGAGMDGARLSIWVEDDGRGLDKLAIAASASRQGMALAEQAESPEQLIFLPGVSSAGSATAVSGRGVGLDVVKSGVESARGQVRVESEPGRFTRFQLLLPLSLTTLRVVLFRLGDHQYALDIAGVEQMHSMPLSELTSLGGQQLVTIDQASIPTVDIRRKLGLAGNDRRSPGERIELLLIRDQASELRLALAVDEVLGIEDVVLKPLGPRLVTVPYVHGAALDGRGNPVPVLNMRELLGAGLAGEGNGGTSLAIEMLPAEQRHRLLVVDDSMTTRLLEENILRDAGFEVVSASDGLQAWELLEQQEFDLVVTDVQMPGMDGFGLTRAIRTSADHQDLPVILLTARDDEADRREGMDAGADAYLVKSAFDLDGLIHTIRRLLI